MKKHLRSTPRLFLCAGFLFFNSALGYSQDLAPSKSNHKADLALRQLTTSSSRLKTSSAKTTSPVAGVSSGLQVASSVNVIDGYVAIDAYSTSADGRELLEQLNKLGMKNGSAYGRVVSGFLPVTQVEKLEQISLLNHATPAYIQKKAGLVTSQGDTILKADVARQKYKVSGKGSKVGVISDSFGSIAGGIAAGVASGDLPADVQILSDITTGTDEGRGMAEIVHDVAPGAQIAFHTAYPGQAAFANGIQSLADKGCNIIVDDIIYLAEPMFQDGIIAQSVDKVVKRNVAYFSAAGNNARQSYQSAFNNSKQVIPEWGEAHNFGGGDIRQSISIPARGNIQLMFQWSDDFFSTSGGVGAKTDLDILVYLNGTLFTASASSNVGRDPYEYIALNNNGSTAVTIEIAIVKYSGPDPQMIKWIEFGSSTPLEHRTNSSSVYGHANAEGAIAVGATAFYNTPYFNRNVTRPSINSYSSLGGTPVFVTPSGQNQGYTSQRIRQKPDVTGPDGGNNTFFGSDTGFDSDAYPNFFGTSAAAPHVAAVAALMQESKMGKMSPGAIFDRLKTSTIDMDNPYTTGVFDTGFDFATGWGFVQADKAIEASSAKANQTISFIEVPDLTISKVTMITLEAFSTSDLPVKFTVLQGPGTVNGNVLTITGRGVIRIKATQTGNSEFTPAADVIQEILVKGVTQTLTFAPLPDLSYGDGPVRLEATSSAGLPVTFQVVSGLAKISGNMLTITGPGRVEVKAIQAGNAFTEPATATQSFMVNKASQTIMFADIPDRTLTESPIQLMATSTSGLPVSFSVLLGPAKVSGNMLTLTGTGTVRLKATQYGNGNYQAAPEVIQEFKVTQAMPTLAAKSSNELSLGADLNEGLEGSNVYPNPFSGVTTIQFSSPEDGQAQVEIFSASGTLVKTLHNGATSAGSTYRYEFNGTGKAAGVYICRITYNGKVEHKRLVLAN